MGTHAYEKLYITKVTFFALFISFLSKINKVHFNKLNFKTSISVILDKRTIQLVIKFTDNDIDP